MSMGKRRRRQQGVLFVATSDLPQQGGHPFDQRVNGVLDQCGFDDYVESLCEPSRAALTGRTGIVPGMYFRMLMIGCHEGPDSERAIARRVSDSLSLRLFLGYGLTDATPGHSSLSKIRQRLPLEVHEKVFTWLVAALGRAGLVKGKAIGIDATTLEANAAIKSIVRRDTVESCDAFLTKLALASGIDTPTRAEPAKIDKHRKHKGNNDDWQHRHDPDAKITKTKDGRTHLAHKTEHAVDFAGGAVAGVTVQPANEGNTTTCRDTVETACRTLNDDKADPIAREKINEQIVEGLVDEKSCHGNQAMVDLKEMGICSHTSDPDRGRRNRQGDKEVRDAVYGNRTPSGPGANTNSWRFDHIAPKEIIETMKKRAWVSGSEATNNE